MSESVVSATPGKRESEFTDDELLKMARDNHIWINAFSTIRPSDAFLADLGLAVLHKLQVSPIHDDLVGLSKVVYIRLNAS